MSGTDDGFPICLELMMVAIVSGTDDGLRNYDGFWCDGEVQAVSWESESESGNCSSVLSHVCTRT